MKEAAILSQVLLAVSQAFHPGVFWRQNAGKVQTKEGRWIDLGPEGISDIVGFLPGGQIVFIETKTRRGRQRESQKRWQAAVEKAGGIYIVARSGEEAIEKIKTLPLYGKVQSCLQSSQANKHVSSSSKS